MSQRMRVSLDSVRRIEAGTYKLPSRPRSSGHALDALLVGLGWDICEVLRECFSEDELADSVYARCISAPSAPATVQRRPESLADYVATLPASKEALMEQAALLNAHAMAFLISLERIFDRFEFLVTNQPPFVLFADDEYVTQGSSSTELKPEDRRTYHQLIFSHRETMRARARSGDKHYKVVLHKDPLIQFLAARSLERSQAFVADFQIFLFF